MAFEALDAWEPEAETTGTVATVQPKFAALDAWEPEAAIPPIMPPEPRAEPKPPTGIAPVSVSPGLSGPPVEKEWEIPEAQARFYGLTAPMPRRIGDRFQTQIGMPESLAERVHGRYIRAFRGPSPEERAREFAASTRPLAFLSQRAMGIYGETPIGKILRNKLNEYELNLHPEQYFNPDGTRKESTNIEVMNDALDAGLLDHPWPVIRWATRDLLGTLTGGDLAILVLASKTPTGPVGGFTAMNIAHQILDNQYRIQRGEPFRMDWQSLGESMAVGLVLHATGLPTALTEREGGIIRNFARQAAIPLIRSLKMEAVHPAFGKAPTLEGLASNYAFMAGLQIPEIAKLIQEGRAGTKRADAAMRERRAAEFEAAQEAARRGQPAYREAEEARERFGIAQAERAEQERANLRAKYRAEEEAAAQEWRELRERAGGRGGVSPAEARQAFEELMRRTGAGLAGARPEPTVQPEPGIAPPRGAVPPVKSAAEVLREGLETARREAEQRPPGRPIVPPPTEAGITPAALPEQPLPPTRPGGLVAPIPPSPEGPPFVPSAGKVPPIPAPGIISQPPTPAAERPEPTVQPEPGIAPPPPKRPWKPLPAEGDSTMAEALGVSKERIQEIRAGLQAPPPVVEPVTQPITVPRAAVPAPQGGLYSVDGLKLRDPDMYRELRILGYTDRDMDRMTPESRTQARNTGLPAEEASILPDGSIVRARRPEGREEAEHAVQVEKPSEEVRGLGAPGRVVKGEVQGVAGEYPEHIGVAGAGEVPPQPQAEARPGERKVAVGVPKIEETTLSGPYKVIRPNTDGTYTLVKTSGDWTVVSAESAQQITAKYAVPSVPPVGERKVGISAVSAADEAARAATRPEPSAPAEVTAPAKPQLRTGEGRKIVTDQHGRPKVFYRYEGGGVPRYDTGEGDGVYLSDVPQSYFKQEGATLRKHTVTATRIAQPKDVAGLRNERGELLNEMRKDDVSFLSQAEIDALKAKGFDAAEGPLGMSSREIVVFDRAQLRPAKPAPVPPAKAPSGLESARRQRLSAAMKPVDQVTMTFRADWKGSIRKPERSDPQYAEIMYAVPAQYFAPASRTSAVSWDTVLEHAKKWNLAPDDAAEPDDLGRVLKGTLATQATEEQAWKGKEAEADSMKAREISDLERERESFEGKEEVFEPPVRTVNRRGEVELGLDEGELRLVGEREAAAIRPTRTVPEEAGQVEMFPILEVIKPEIDPGKTANAAIEIYGTPRDAIDHIKHQLAVIDSDPKQRKDFTKEQRARLRDVMALLEEKAIPLTPERAIEQGKPVKAEPPAPGLAGMAVKRFGAKYAGREKEYEDRNGIPKSEVSSWTSDERVRDVLPSERERSDRMEGHIDRFVMSLRTGHESIPSGMERLLEGKSIQFDRGRAFSPEGRRVIGTAERLGYSVGWVKGFTEAFAEKTNHIIIVSPEEPQVAWHEILHAVPDSQRATSVQLINQKSSGFAMIRRTWLSTQQGRIFWRGQGTDILKGRGERLTEKNIAKATDEAIAENLMADFVADTDRAGIDPKLYVTSMEEVNKFKAILRSGDMPIEPEVAAGLAGARGRRYQSLEPSTEKGPPDPQTLSREILNRMDQRLKSVGYDSRGVTDVRSMLEKQHKQGGFWNDDWRDAYRSATESVAKRKITLGEARQIEVDHPAVDRKRVQSLGYTSDIREAGYITPDGRLIDLSGKREGGTPGTRSLDHREVGGTDGMQEFMAEGNIRMDYHSGALDLYREPTRAQLAVIERIASDRNGDVTIDLQRGLGEKSERDPHDIHYLPGADRFSQQYDVGTNPNRIRNEIRRYFGGEQASGLAGGRRYQQTEREKDYAKRTEEARKDGSPEWQNSLPSRRRKWDRLLEDYRQRLREERRRGEPVRDSEETWASIQIAHDEARTIGFEKAHRQFQTLGVEVVPVKRSPFGGLLDEQAKVVFISSEGERWGDPVEIADHERFHRDLDHHVLSAKAIRDAIEIDGLGFVAYVNRLKAECPQIFAEMWNNAVGELGLRDKVPSQSDVAKILQHVKGQIADEIASDWAAQRIPETVFKRGTDSQRLLKDWQNSVEIEAKATEPQRLGQPYRRYGGLARVPPQPPGPGAGNGLSATGEERVIEEEPKRNLHPTWIAHWTKPFQRLAEDTDIPNLIKISQSGRTTMRNMTAEINDVLDRLEQGFGQQWRLTEILFPERKSLREVASGIREGGGTIPAGYSEKQRNAIYQYLALQQWAFDLSRKYAEEMGIDTSRWTPDPKTYFHHMFVGKWHVVEHRPDGTKVEISGGTANTGKEALKIRSEYIKTHPGADVRVHPKEVGDVFMATLLGRRAWFALVNRIGKNTELTVDEVLESGTMKGVAAIKRKRTRVGAFMQRKVNLQGYEKDPLIVTRALLARVIRKKYLDPWTKQAYADAETLPPAYREQAEWYIRQLSGEWDPYDPDFAWQRALGKWTRGMAVVKLGYRPVSTAVNLLQPVQTTWPTLGNYLFRGYASLTDSAMRELLKKENVVSDVAKVYTVGEHPKHARIGGLGQLLKPLGMFQAAEKINRQSVFAGAYLKAKEVYGWDDSRAIQYAHDVSDRYNFMYGAGEVPRFTSSKGGRTIFQFRNFGINWLWTAKQYLWDNFRKGVPDSRLQAVRFVLGNILSGGMKVIPFAQKLAFYAVLMQYPWLAQGLFKLFGVDISANVSAFDVLPRDTTEMLGVTGGTLKQLYMAARKIGENEREQALRRILSISPVTLGMYEAIIGKHPITWAGKRYDVTLTGRERAVKALGFKPSRVGEIETAAYAEPWILPFMEPRPRPGTAKMKGYIQRGEVKLNQPWMRRERLRQAKAKLARTTEIGQPQYVPGSYIHYRSPNEPVGGLQRMGSPSRPRETEEERAERVSTQARWDEERRRARLEKEQRRWK